MAEEIGELDLTAQANAAQTATNYISADSTGIRIANSNPSTATTYQNQTATETEFIVDGVSMTKIGGDGVRVGRLGAAHVEISQKAMAVSTGNLATDKRFVAGLANDPVTGLATVELFGVLDTVQIISGVEYYAIINDGIEPASFTAIEIDGVSHSVTGLSHSDTAILLDKTEYATYSRSVVKITYTTEDPVPTMFYGTSFNVSGVNTGPNSAAFGYMSSALGLASFAAGYNADAWGAYSAAIGQNSDAYGRNSVAFGYGAETGAKGKDSIALGRNAKTDAMFAISAGTGVVSQNLEETVLGAYNDYVSDVNPYGRTQYNNRGKYALIIGNGTADNARSNATTIDWNGNYLGQAMAGIIQMFAGATPPSGWLVCDGSAVSRTTYATLFAAIGTTWGTGDGSTTFNLPDLRGRAPIGAGTGSGLTARTLGTQNIGSENVQAHTHSISRTTNVAVSDSGHTHPAATNNYYYALGSATFEKQSGHAQSGSSGLTNAVRQSGTVSSNKNTGSGKASLSVTQPVFSVGAVSGATTGTEGNMQPSAVVNFIICTGKTS